MPMIPRLWARLSGLGTTGKSDFFAVEKTPYHYSPTIHSPGHVRLSFGPSLEVLQRAIVRLAS